MMKRYDELFPDVAYTADFRPPPLWRRSGTRGDHRQGQFEATALKQAALDLPGQMVVMTGPYEIEESGKQVSMEFVVMQKLPDGLEVVYPQAVQRSEPVYPVPPFSER